MLRVTLAFWAPPPEWGSRAPAGSTGLALTEALLQGSSEN